MATKDTLPTARQMVPVLLDALKKAGGDATVRELEELVARELGLTSDQISIRHDKSRSEFQYRFAWTRTYAKRDGLIILEKRNHCGLARVEPES